MMADAEEGEKLFRFNVTAVDGALVTVVDPLSQHELELWRQVYVVSFDSQLGLTSKVSDIANCAATDADAAVVAFRERLGLADG